MADEIILNQNIQMLTQALNALNQNMFKHTGGRSSVWGPNTQVPGTSTNKGNTEDKNTIKAIATNTLLNATMRSNTDTVKYLIKDSKKNMQDLGKYTQMSAQYFKTAIKDFGVKQLDSALPKKLNSYLQDSIAKGIIPQLKNFEDVVKLQRRANIQNIDAAIRLAKEYGDATTSIARQTQIRETIEQQTGFNLNELGQAVRDDGKLLKQHAGEISKGMAEFTADMYKMEERWNKLSKAGEILAGVATVLGADLYGAAIAAQQYGTEVTLKTIPQAALAGMTAEELIKTQNENIQAIHSSGMSFDTFNKKLDQGASDLLAWTGHLQYGAKITAGAFSTFRKLSNNTEEQNGFITQQQQLFVKMNRTLGVTADQFVEMNNELINNSAVQAQMYKVSAAQRINLIKGMQLQVQQLALDGLTIEQSKKLVESLSEITGGKAKERYTEAARIQGILGALGLGKQGQRAAEIIRKGQRASPQELKELAQIQVEAQRSVSSKYAKGGPAMEFQLDALTDVIGKFLGPSSPGAQLATSQGQAVNEQTAAVLGQTKALDGLTKDYQKQLMFAEKSIQVAQSGFSGVITAIKNIAALMIGGKLFGGLKNLLKYGIQRGAVAGEGLTAAEGVGAGGAAIGGGIGLSGVAAATGVGLATYGITTLLTDTLPKALGAKQGFGEWIGGKIYDEFHKKEMANITGPVSAAEMDKYRISRINQDNEKIATLKKQAQTDETAKQIAELTAQVKRLTEIQQKHLDQTKTLTQITQQGIQQQAAQTDDHINVTRKIIEERDTRRAPMVQ